VQILKIHGEVYMRFWGVAIAIFGAIIYGLFLLGRKPALLFFIDKSAMPIVAIVCGVIGLVLFIVSFFVKKKSAKKKDNEPSDSGATPNS
jgi:hypothetical protein